MSRLKFLPPMFGFMPQDHDGKRRNQILIAGLLTVLFVAMFLAAHVRIHETLIDDAYITYRYAANFAEGEGLVYNKGERVLGTTTPGYALLLGSLGYVFGPEEIPSLSRGLNIVAMVLTATAVAYLALRIGANPIAAGLLVGIVLLGPFTLYASIAGMESSLFLLLLATGAAALYHKKWGAAALFIGLTPLIRPEGFFALGLLLVGFAYQATRSAREISWRRNFVILSALLLPSLALVIAATAYYGSPIPQSVVAKQAGVYPLTIEDSATTLWIRSSHLLPTEGLMSPPQDFSSFNMGVILFIVMALTTIIGMCWMARQSFSYHIFPLLLVLLVLFYATSKTLIFPHYIAHFEILAKVCLLAGMVAIISAVRSFQQYRQLRKLAVLIALMSVLWPNLYNYPFFSVIKGQADPRDPLIDPSFNRQQQYRVLAQQIAPLLPPNTVVAMPEIGELGFFLPDVKVLDACGLVSPEVVKYFPVPADQRHGPAVGVVPPELVKDYKPDLIILYEIFGRYGILDDDWFWEDYEPVIIRQGDWLPWGSTALYVFSRKDFGPGQILAEAVNGEQAADDSIG